GSSPVAAAAPERPAVQGELFPFGANVGEEDGSSATDNGQRTTDGWKATYHLVDTPKKFQAFLKQLRKQKRIAVDLETTRPEPRRADMVGYAFCWQPGEAWYLTVRGPEGAAVLDPEATLEALRPVLTDPGVAKVNQNIKYDRLVLRQQGVEVAGVVGDPMVA